MLLEFGQHLMIGSLGFMLGGVSKMLILVNSAFNKNTRTLSLEKFMGTCCCYGGVVGILFLILSFSIF